MCGDFASSNIRNTNSSPKNTKKTIRNETQIARAINQVERVIANLSCERGIPDRKRDQKPQLQSSVSKEDQAKATTDRG